VTIPQTYEAVALAGMRSSGLLNRRRFRSSYRSSKRLTQHLEDDGANRQIPDFPDLKA